MEPLQSLKAINSIKLILNKAMWEQFSSTQTQLIVITASISFLEKIRTQNFAFLTTFSPLLPQTTGHNNNPLIHISMFKAQFILLFLQYPIST